MKGQELKHRINGAGETVKITRAMQLISAAKISKIQDKLEASRDFIREMKNTLTLIGNVSHPLFEKRANPKTAYVVIASDKGLCGDYNHCVFDYADKVMKNTNTVKIYTVGQYCREHFIKRGIKVSNAYIHMMQEPFIEDAKNITEDLTKAFIEGEIDEAIVVYTAVENGNAPGGQEVVARPLLPLTLPEQKSQSGYLGNINDLTSILKQYIWTRIYFALCCASLAENYKRMVAMQQATTNGETLAEELRSQYNHLRQESITTELIDAGINKRGRQV